MATAAALDAATKLEDLAAREAALRAIVLADAGGAADAETVKNKEAAVGALSDALTQQGKAAELAQLLQDLRGFFAVIPKAKTAKIVRTVIDQIAKVPDSTELQVKVCEEQAAWAKSEKRTFLRQRIDLRLASLRLQRREYPLALSLIALLLSEVKRLDDKLLLVDVHLLESRAHHALRNLPKARAALTAARTAANAIYVPVLTQAEIDGQSGVLHAEEKDYKTGYSYFFEAFEQYASLGDTKGAIPALKYMLLCKVMAGGSADVPSLAAAKAGARFAGRDVDALVAVARAHQDRSLALFQQALETYKVELSGDAVVHSHLSSLYDALLEGNLARLVEPYSRVEVDHLAKLIGLPKSLVEQKLSQMVLDKRLLGTLDQGSGCLDVFPPAVEEKLYPPALELMDALGGVLETLFARSQKLVSV